MLGCAALVAALLPSFLSACSRSAEAPPVPVEPARFEDVTEAAGIARITPTYDAAVGDFDGDGREDLFVGNHASPAALLHNVGAGRFEDVISSARIDPSGDKHGTGWGDFDNDGRLDLYVSVGAGRGLATKQNKLYRNEGDGRFRDVAAPAGVTDPSGRSRSVAWLDVDADGFLDLLVTNYLTPNRLYRNRGDGTFEEVGGRFGVGDLSATRVSWGDVDSDGFPDLLLSGTNRGLRLLRNDGGQRFVDVTETSGLAGLAASISGAAFGDYDNDGILDLYLGHGVDFADTVLEGLDQTITYAFFAGSEPVGFDFESDAETLELDAYENGSPQDPARTRCGAALAPSTAPGKFRCAALDARATAPPPGDGLVLWSEPSRRTPCAGCAQAFTWHLRWNGTGDHHLTGVIRGGSKPVSAAFTRAVQTGGSLWRGTPRGVFERVDEKSVQHDANAQAVQWADVNDDGALDLYVVDSGVDGAGGRNVLFLNDGRGRFQRADEQSGASPSSGAGRGVGAHFFDFDADGRLDLFLTNGWGAPPFDQGPYRLLRNTVRSPGHWLDVDLDGKRSNRAGLGAWIHVDACGKTQSRYHNGETSYYSQSVARPHFGLGACAQVDRLRVRWPSGVEQELADLPVDRVVTVTETVG